MNIQGAQKGALRVLRNNKRVPVAGAVFVAVPEVDPGIRRCGLMVLKCPICGGPHTHLSSPDPATARGTLTLGRFRCPEGMQGFDIYIVQEIPASVLKLGGYVSKPS
ncbi:hypothetical protein [uncultured Paludibaculum sp.]|uniref:hypothetical protein n=1 Tax=uncultured Paludibaculum sp. TaxID=1765020 RepID=UPI002AABAD05|nr:hypothetical protein [uncultured Paludibaculum sp.]